MNFKKSGAYTVILEPDNTEPVWMRSGDDTGTGNQVDTGGAHDWINKVKVSKQAEGKWYLGDTGWADDTGGALYPWNKGTVLEIWRRYDTGVGVNGDWDKTSWRVTL
jgi:hypothetical protein